MDTGRKKRHTRTERARIHRNTSAGFKFRRKRKRDISIVVAIRLVKLSDMNCINVSVRFCIRLSGRNHLNRIADLCIYTLCPPSSYYRARTTCPSPDRPRPCLLSLRLCHTVFYFKLCCTLVGKKAIESSVVSDFWWYPSTSTFASF